MTLVRLHRSCYSPKDATGSKLRGGRWNPIYAEQTMTDRPEQSLWTRQAYSWRFGAFAASATFLAAIGVYGTVSYAVSLHAREIGIRVALGASPASVEGGLARRNDRHLRL